MDIVDSEQIEDIIAMINDMGIEVHEFVPDTETLLLNENPVSADDDVVAEEAAAALAAVDSEFGRTTDPVRMYMRRDGHGRTADPRGRNPDRQTHRGRDEPGAVGAGQLSADDCVNCCEFTTRSTRTARGWPT